MLLAIRDKNIKDLQSKLEERRQILLEQHKNLKKTTKENEFLEEVAQDYNLKLLIII